MVGVYEADAEDAVSRALEKWTRIPATKQEARIEQVVKSESDSQVRAARRRLNRDHNATADRALSTQREARPTAGFSLLLSDLLRTAQRIGVDVSEVDVNVLLLLFAGFSISDVERTFGIRRHRVRSSRETWRKIVEAMNEC